MPPGFCRIRLGLKSGRRDRHGFRASRGSAVLWRRQNGWRTTPPPRDQTGPVGRGRVVEPNSLITIINGVKPTLSSIVSPHDSKESVKELAVTQFIVTPFISRRRRTS